MARAKREQGPEQERPGREQGQEALRGRYSLLFGIGGLVVLADQVSKYLVMKSLPSYETVTVIPGFFDLVNIRNRGAAFGFLNRHDIEWQFWLFAVATVVAAGVILTLTRTAERGQHWLVAGLGLVLGGALGNLVDRVRFRAVVDFLDFYVGQWHWPAFNVADIAICCGAALVCMTFWFGPKGQASQPGQERSGPDAGKNSRGGTKDVASRSKRSGA